MAAKIELIEYNNGMLWFQKKGDILTIGITAAAFDEIGDAEAIDFPPNEEEFEKDDVVCEVDGSEGAIRVYTPAGGTLVAVNTGVKEDISLLNEDPLEEGWLVQIEIQDETELKEYL